jgi:hypothetical protein
MDKATVEAAVIVAIGLLSLIFSELRDITKELKGLNKKLDAK